MPKLPALQTQTLRTPAAPKLPTTRLNGPATTHRVGDGFRFELATAKQLRAPVPGSTVNDVVLTIVGGGLRSYLAGTGDLPPTSLFAGVPVSLRTAEDAGTAGNKISITLASLGTDIADPIERLRAVQASTSSWKEQNGAESARTMAETAELFPGALMGAAVRALPQLGAGGITSMIGNVCVTNVPGSQAPLYLRGARMDAYYGLGPVYDHAGPIHMIVSYRGDIYLAVTSCREILPDVERYIACMEGSLAELVAAAAPEPPRAKRRASTRARTPAEPTAKRRRKADA
jgi:WS/DGAT/MGAT family acyltransferase